MHHDYVCPFNVTCSLGDVNSMVVHDVPKLHSRVYIHTCQTIRTSPTLRDGGPIARTPPL